MKKPLTKDLELVVKKIQGAFDGTEEYPAFADFNHVGRLRLMNSLIKKHGPGFHSVSRAREALKAFDGEMSFAHQLRYIKEGGNRGV